MALATPAFAATDVAPVAGTPCNAEGSFPIVYEWGLESPYCVGIGWDGFYFWVSSGDQYTGSCDFYIFDDLGNLMDIVPQNAGATGWGHRDLCWVCDCNGQPCAHDGVMLGSYSNSIDAFCCWFHSQCAFKGFFNGPISPCRALTDDGNRNIYTCGFGEYCWVGYWNCMYGNVVTWTQGGGPWDGCYGLAYDCDLQCLWMTTADYTGNLYQLDLNCNLMNQYTFLPEYDIQGGCEMAYTPSHGTVLAVIHQFSPDMVSLYDVGSQCATEEETWGSIKAMYK
jgi:hypothetical protein